MGPKYRKKHWGMDIRIPDPDYAPPSYLRKETYGDKAPRYGEEGWKMEWDLFRRYFDYYYRRAVTGNGTVEGGGVARDGELEHVLPNPFNMGELWYEEAKRKVIEDVERRADWNVWMAHWSDSYIFSHITYREKLKVLQNLELKRGKKELENKKGIWLVQKLAAERLSAWGRRNLRLWAWWVGNLPEMRPWPGVRGKEKGRAAEGGGRNSVSGVWSQGHMI